ncbi:MAG TPA: AraC family transcriptional regulator [bacterium]|nr:AraC family transcriptional regulator [bacterium]
MGSVWDKRKAVQRMQEFIEEHLGEPISMRELAATTHYSMFYAARIFKEITGRSPFEYIRLRRLSAAALSLEEGRARVVDVAFDFVFDSHEGFTRAFTRQFGVPPSRLQSVNWSAFLFQPGSATDFYQDRQKGSIDMSQNEKEQAKKNVIFVQILERPHRKLIFRPAKKATHYFEYCEEVGCDVWDELVKIEHALHEPMGLWLPDNLRPAGTSTYVQGVEVGLDYDGPLPKDCRTIELPPCKLLVFQGEPFDDKDFEQAIVSLWDVMNAYKPETIGYEWADGDAPRFQLAPMGYRGYIEGRPVRPVTDKG